MPKEKKKVESPRIAHVDFYVEKEKLFVNYVKYLSNPWHVFWRNFLAGSARGLGFVLGTALLFWFLGWFVSTVLGEIPVFSDISQILEIWIENNTL